MINEKFSFVIMHSYSSRSVTFRCPCHTPAVPRSSPARRRFRRSAPCAFPCTARSARKVRGFPLPHAESRRGRDCSRRPRVPGQCMFSPWGSRPFRFLRGCSTSFPSMARCNMLFFSCCAFMACLRDVYSFVMFDVGGKNPLLTKKRTDLG